MKQLSTRTEQGIPINGPPRDWPARAYEDVSQLGTFNGALDVRQQAGGLVPQMPAPGDDGHCGIIGQRRVHVDEQYYHGDVTCDGEDVDGCHRLFADVDLLVRDVIADSKSLLRSVGLALLVSSNGSEWPHE